VQVRNRFQSALDGEPFRTAQGRDANSSVYNFLGKTMRVGELAHHMIVTSSNLATNLLVDLVGIDAARQTLAGLGIQGVQFKRGVEDEKAFERGINNLVTANGLVQMFRLIEEEQAVSPEASREMLDILHRQELGGGISAGLPDAARAQARVAHKTGEISTVAHDAGLVFLPGRKPYAVGILTEWPLESGGQQEAVAKVSRAVYENLTDG
jgi:beta-lactamase class A